MKHTYLLAFLFSLIQIIGFSQSDSTKTKHKYTKSILGAYQAGRVLPTNEFVKGDNAAGKPIDYYQSFSLKYGIDTDGSKYWEQLYKYPTWGFGIYGANFFNSEELGTPSSIYTFFRAPFIKRRKWSFNYRAMFGFSYNWKPFDPNVNPFNYAIGSYNTVFVDAGISLGYDLTDRIDVNLGGSFTHFSNGATRVPNMGINLMSPFVELKYSFKDRPKPIKQPEQEYKKNWEYVALIALSRKQLAFDTSETTNEFVPQTYDIITFSTGVNYQVNHLVKFGAGIDFGYDEAHNSYVTYKDGVVIPMNAGTGNKFALGIYPSFELVINKVSVVVQPGWYIWREENQIPEYTPENGAISPTQVSNLSYQRIGLKYHIIKDRVFVGFNVRAFNFSIADYLEWNFGYRIKWRKE